MNDQISKPTRHRSLEAFKRYSASPKSIATSQAGERAVVYRSSDTPDHVPDNAISMEALEKAFVEFRGAEVPDDADGDQELVLRLLGAVKAYMEHLKEYGPGEEGAT